MTLNIVPVTPVGSVRADMVYADVSALPSVSGAAFGGPDPSRRIIAFIGGQYGSIASVTIGGVAATSVVGGANGIEVALAFIAHVPSGNTGNVVITGGGGTYKLVLYALYESSSTPFDTTSVAGTVIGLDIPERGIAIAYRSHQAAANTTWSGVDEDTDLASGVSGGSSGASREFTTAQVGHGISASGGTLASPVLLGLSFGP